MTFCYFVRLNFSSARLLLILILFGIWVPSAISQTNSSQQNETELDLIIRGNSGAQTPFWLEHNRYDLIPDRPGGQLGFRFQERMHLDRDTRLLLGAELYGRTDGAFLDRPIHQAYLGLNYQNLLLTIGKREETVGIVHQGLSAGPTIWSGNARTMPKVKLELTEFSPLPFTDEWVSVKGGISHGWFDSEREVENFYLHEKYAYLQVGKRPWPQAYVGLIHMAQWGGYDNRKYGALPERFSDYMRIFFARAGDERSPEGWQVNKIGNHVGAWQAGIHYEIGHMEFLVNRSAIFEDGSGFTLRSPEDGLWGINVRHWHSGAGSDSAPGLGGGVFGPGLGSGSGLLGSGSPRSGLAELNSGSYSASGSAETISYTSFIWEFWHTKTQTSPGLHVPPEEWEGDPHYDDQGHRFGGQDNYFNHGVYQAWSYHNRILGVPLITLDPSINRVVNNRLIAHHLGLEHRRGAFKVWGTWTWSKNYGTYEFPYEERIYQQSLLIGVAQALDSWIELPVTMSLEAGLDRGDLVGNRSGILVSLVYRILQ